MNRGPHERGRGGSRPSAHSPNKNGNSESSSSDPRKKLEALFNGGNGNGGAPRDNNGRREQRFAGPRKSMGKNPSEYRMRLERLRGARDVDEIREAADVYLQHHQLPDDTDILYKVLQHPNEKVVRDALGQISSLIMQGRIQSNVLLEERLKTLAERELTPATRSFVEGVQAQTKK